MASISTSNFVGSYGAKTICQIVGISCVAGFLMDLVILSLPANIFDMQWRINLIQQMSDRSIILLFGAALLMFGNLENRRLLRQIALSCLVVGILFHLCSILIVRDGIMFQQQAVKTINSQATQLQTQIQQNQPNSGATKGLTPEQLQQASQLVNQQAASLKQQAQTTVMKTGISSVGNLVVVGLGLVSLGRYGMRSR